MPLAINSNISALAADGSLRSNGLRLSNSMERLSTGIRINSAKDDAAGLAISNRMNIKIHSLEVAIRNASNGISLLQTAEGGLGSISDNLQRIRELAVQSANAVHQPVDHKFLSGEADQLVSEIDRIAENTTFNGIKLLDGSFKDKKFQIGANNTANDSLTVSIPSAHITQKQNIAKTIQYHETKLVTEVVTHTTYSSHAGGNVVSLSGLNAGDLSLNGVSIGASSGGSAKDIASAINLKTSLSGVTATAIRTTATPTTPVVSNIAAVIDLGSYGSLISPVQVDGGKTYYRWQKNSLSQDRFYFSHDELDLLFTKNINGDINSGNNTTDDYRYATLNGVSLALPTMGGVASPPFGLIGVNQYPVNTPVGSIVPSNGSNELNTTYDDYLAIWDAFNGKGPGGGTWASLPNWNWGSSSFYWTATQTSSGHAAIAVSGDARSTNDAWPQNFVAVQVINPPGSFDSIAIDAIELNGVNIGPIESANSSAERATQMLNAINAKTSSTGVAASIDSTTGGVNLSAADGRNIVISTLASASITGDQIGIALNGATSGSRSVTTYGSSIDLTSTSSSGITIVANGNGISASGLTPGVKTPTETITTETVTTEVPVVVEKSQVAEGYEKLFFINLISVESSQASLASIDKAIDFINQSRAALGGYQSRFSSAVDVTESEISNLTSSRSRIIDADYALETTNLAKFQIMSQAATSMLAQANIPNQSVLTLLKDF